MSESQTSNQNLARKFIMERPGQFDIDTRIAIEGFGAWLDALCVVCQTELPPLNQWSMPACPSCTGKAERASAETTAGPTTFEVRNGPTSLPCDHCRKSVSDHLCPTTKRAPLAPERQPDGYAYRYRHWDGGYVLRFNGGEEVNLSKPIEAVPYWLGHAEPRFDAAGFPEKTTAELGPYHSYVYGDGKCGCTVLTREKPPEFCAHGKRVQPDADVSGES